MILIIKHLIKKYLWSFVFRNKIYNSAPKKNKAFISLLNTSPIFSNELLNIFTKNNEDGILLNIFTKIGTTNKYFIDIGSNDCINSNCANLSFHHNWSGTFIDGNSNILKRGKYIYQQYFESNANKFSFVHAIVTIHNINNILKNVNCPQQPDLLCIDLDGNDYHIWKAIDIILPRVVLVEVQIEKGDTEFIPLYSNHFELYEDNLPKGASPVSMVQLANKKGYQLVATNYGRYNLFFVRVDCMRNLKCLKFVI
jgi:hypothetical protein